jgi:hypothetical protein
MGLMATNFITPNSTKVNCIARASRIGAPRVRDIIRVRGPIGMHRIGAGVVTTSVMRDIMLAAMHGT